MYLILKCFYHNYLHSTDTLIQSWYDAPGGLLSILHRGVLGNVNDKSQIF